MLHGLANLAKLVHGIHRGGGSGLGVSGEQGSDFGLSCFKTA